MSAQDLLVISINYAPEQTGIAPYAAGLASGLASSGKTVRVITAKPHYPSWQVWKEYRGKRSTELLGDVQVHRVNHFVPKRPAGLARLLSELSFGVSAVFSKWGRRDAIFLVSPALFAAVLIMMRAKLTHRSSRTVVWVQDLYSLGVSETGGSSGLSKVMSLAESWLLQNADEVVAIHETFATYIKDTLGTSSEKVSVIKNWTHISQSMTGDRAARRRDLGWSEDETIVLHAGNMGVKQGLENVIAAAKVSGDLGCNVRFVLMGDGSQKESLVTLATGLDKLDFLASVPDSLFSATLQAADLLLVNEQVGVSAMSVPSKLTSYFGSGVPVVAATDLSGITASEVQRANAGIVVEAGEPNKLLEAIITLAEAPEILRTLGANGLAHSQAGLGSEKALSLFISLLD